MANKLNGTALITSVASMVVSLIVAAVAQLGLSPRIQENTTELNAQDSRIDRVVERIGPLELTLRNLEGIGNRVERRFEQFAERAYKQGVRDARRELGLEP